MTDNNRQPATGGILTSRELAALGYGDREATITIHKTRGVGITEVGVAVNTYRRALAEKASLELAALLLRLRESGGDEPQDAQLLAAIESWRAGDVG